MITNITHMIWTYYINIQISMSTYMYPSDYMMNTTIATPIWSSHTYSLGLTDDHE